MRATKSTKTKTPKPRAAHLAPRVLEGMGVTQAEEQLYRALLRCEGLSIAEIAAKLNSSARAIAAPLRALESKGMVTHSPARVPRYYAVPPDIAVEALIAKSQLDEELRQRNARASVVKLSAMGALAEHAVADERLVEILSPEATAQMFAQMHRTAQVEMISLTRRPMLISKVDEPDDLLFQCLERGVRCRALIDADLLSMPGWLEHMRDNTAHGEECRIAASLPFKLIVADRRIAIIPLDLGRPDGPVLLVRSSSLLDALCEVFELLWRNATPFPSSDTEQATNGRRRSMPLLSLLTSGVNDKAIELELGMSHRTLARRISELMEEFGAATRCQLGWLVAQRAAGASIR
jgi:sugar-specific transcriptional regulator TrmB